MNKTAIRMTIDERRYVAVPEEKWAEILEKMTPDDFKYKQ